MKILFTLSMLLGICCTLFVGCQQKTDPVADVLESPVNYTQEVQQAFESFWSKFNGGQMADSIVFNQTMSFFADDLLMPGDTGKLPGDGKGLFGWLKGYVQNNKPFFDVTVDRIEATKDMAYVLYRYHETFTDLATGEYSVDVKHSAIMVLRRNDDGIWKCVVMKFT